MLVAGLWGFVGGVALVVGAVLGLARQFSPRTIGLVMAFGAGVLISALAFELTKEAYDSAGAREVVIGLAAGALTFYVGDRLLDRIGGKQRKRSGGTQSGPGDDAKGLVLGALLDGIPESAAIGITLVGGGPVGVAVVVAVFLSNIPEAMSAATGLRKAGHSPRWILTLWTGIAVASGLVAALAYALLGGASSRCARGHPGLRRRRDPDDAGRHDDAGGVRERRTARRPRHHHGLRGRVPPEPAPVAGASDPPDGDREALGAQAVGEHAADADAAVSTPARSGSRSRSCTSASALSPSITDVAW